MKMRTILRLLLLALVMLALTGTASADVWLPASLTEIESQAFMNAAWLSGSCVIPEGAKSIGAQAFYNCSGITSLTIPETVTYIGSKAFGGCTGLTGSVTIPEGCEVAADAFEGCTGLTVIMEGAEDPSELFDWTISGGCVTITAYKGGKDVTTVTVPAAIEGCPVTAIADYVFSSNRYLTSVTLPHSITEIGTHSFSYCSRLTTVTLPATVNTLGRYAFYYSSALSGSIDLIDTDIPSNAFTGCKKLSVFAYSTNGDDALTLSRYYGSQTSVSVPRRVGKLSVTAIGREAFSYRTALREVTLPSGITEIGQSAFYYCTALESINIPYGVTSIGPSAFYNCPKLAEISLPGSIDSIGSMAFYGCTSLSANISFIDAQINSSAFNSLENVSIWCYTRTSDAEVKLLSCSSSASAITVPETVEDYTVTGIAPQAFYGCGSMTSVSLPGSITAISEEAFLKCTTLQRITLPESISFIGQRAFYGCTALTEIAIPAAVTEIGNQAFYGCTALTSLTVQSSTTQLGPYAFANCTALTTLEMPGSFANVGNMSFNNTPWLQGRVAAIARSVTTGCTTSREKALALHNWLINNTAYDLSYTHYGSEGVLFHGLGVCNAYTMTYSLMLDAVGIPNMTVTGTATDRNSGNSGSHAWTLVQLDGSWYHVDTTWDDPIPDGRERQTYFCLTDAQIDDDHTWDRASYPASK